MIKHDEKMTSITSSQSGIVVITEWNCKCSRQHYFLEASKLNISCKILCRPHCDSHLFLNTVCKYILEKCPLFGLWSFCLLPQGCGTLRCFSLDLPLTKHCGSWLRQVGILSAFMSDYWSGGKPLCVWYGVLVLSLFLCISAHLFHLHLYLSFLWNLEFFLYTYQELSTLMMPLSVKEETPSWHFIVLFLISLQNNRNLNPSLTHSVFIFSHKSPASYLYVHGSHEGAHGVTSWFIWYANEGEIIQISPDFFCWHASSLTSKTSQSSQMCIF